MENRPNHARISQEPLDFQVKTFNGGAVSVAVHPCGLIECDCGHEILCSVVFGQINTKWWGTGGGSAELRGRNGVGALSIWGLE